MFAVEGLAPAARGAQHPTLNWLDICLFVVRRGAAWPICEMMTARPSSWLLGSPEDARRLREIERSVTRARQIALLAMVSTIPWLVHEQSTAVLSVGLTFAAFTVFADRRARNSPTPQRWMFAVVIATQIGVAVGAAITGGPRSAVILWAVVPMVSMPSRFGSRATWIGAALTFAGIAAAGLSHGWQALATYPDLTLVTAAVSVACLAYGRALQQNEGAQRRAAARDPLTGLYNRAILTPHLEELQEAAVGMHEIAVLAIDLDFFKRVNDEHGHATGDEVLRVTAEVLRAVAPQRARLHRVGGEEFLVLLPEAVWSEAEALAHDLRRGIASSRPAGLHVTASIGVALAPAATFDHDDLIRAADEALYAAKRRGRDRVELADHNDRSRHVLAIVS